MLGPELIAELRGRARAAEHGRPRTLRRAATGSRAAVAGATSGLRDWLRRPVRPKGTKVPGRPVKDRQYCKHG